MICSYCKTNEASGVWASNFGPVSLAECDECLNHPTLRPLRTGLIRWVSYGDITLNERGFNPSDTKVYFNGEYQLLKEVINNLTKEEIDLLLNNTTKH